MSKRVRGKRSNPIDGVEGEHEHVEGVEGAHVEGEPELLAEGEDSEGVEGAHVGGAHTSPAPMSQPEPQPVLEETQEEEYVESDPRLAKGANSKNAYERDRAKVFADVGKLGRENGQGKKSLVALCEKLVQAAEGGFIVPDDAEKFYKKFRDESAKASGKFAAADQDGNSLKANVSKLRRLIIVGSMWGGFAESDGAFTSPWDMFEMARDMHVQSSAGEDRDLLRSKGTYETLVNVARRQLDEKQRNVVLTEEDVRQVVHLEEHDVADKTALDFVVDALIAAEKALKGKRDTPKKAGRAPLDHGNLEDAIAHLRHTIADIDPEVLTLHDAKSAPKAPKETKASLQQAA